MNSREPELEDPIFGTYYNEIVKDLLSRSTDELKAILGVLNAKRTLFSTEALADSTKSEIRSANTARQGVIYLFHQLHAHRTRPELANDLYNLGCEKSKVDFFLESVSQLTQDVQLSGDFLFRVRNFISARRRLTTSSVQMTYGSLEFDKNRPAVLFPVMTVTFVS